MTFKGRKEKDIWKVMRKKVREDRNVDEFVEGIIKTRRN